MNDKLNVQDLINSLSFQNNVSKEETEKFIIELFSTIELGLGSDELVKIKDFGTFKLTQIQERESVDVNTQEKIVIPSHRRVNFIPAHIVKYLVNKPFAHFETTPLNEGIVLGNIEIENTLQDIENEDDYIAEDNEHPLDKGEENKSIPNSKVSDTNNLEINNTTYPIEEIKEDIIASFSVDDSPNNNKEDINEKEDLIVEDDASVEKTKSAKEASKVGAKPKRSYLPWYITTAMVVIVVVVIALNFYQPNGSSTKQSVEESEIPKPIKESTLPVDETQTIETIAAPMNEPLETVKMAAGKTLRLIALDKYGSREFWVYIYLKNKDKIKNPDVIPVGLELTLPRKDEFDINKNNPESVAIAKKLGDEEMKKYW